MDVAQPHGTGILQEKKGLFLIFHAATGSTLLQPFDSLAACQRS